MDNEGAALEALDTELDLEFQGSEVAGVALPFAYAKLNSVLLEEEGGKPVVVHLGQPALEVLTELRRILGGPFALQSVSEDEFQRRLSLGYHRGNNEAVQMAEDLSADIDLTRLAEEIPETGDLMEAEDDAPIIRLINAILSQAVREQASEIGAELRG